MACKIAEAVLCGVVLTKNVGVDRRSVTRKWDFECFELSSHDHICSRTIQSVPKRKGTTNIIGENVPMWFVV